MSNFTSGGHAFVTGLVMGILAKGNATEQYFADISEITDEDGYMPQIAIRHGHQTFLLTVTEVGD